MTEANRLSSVRATAIGTESPRREPDPPGEPPARRRGRPRSFDGSGDRAPTVEDLIVEANHQLAGSPLIVRPARARHREASVIAVVVDARGGRVLRKLDDRSLRQLALGAHPPGAGIALDREV